MNEKRKLVIFCLTFVLAFIYWRLRVFFVYNNGAINPIRAATGLEIHHYHFGIMILTISLLFYLFYKQSNITIAFLGFGLGSVLDGFLSGLLESSTRIQEIMNYNFAFYISLLVFEIIIFFSIVLYLVRYKKLFHFILKEK